MAPLIAHVIYRLSTGGMENGLVNLINRIPPQRYRHCVICLSDADRFRDRIAAPDVEIVELHKREGQDWRLYPKLWRALRRRRPAIIHTRNLAAVESQLPAWLAGVRGRVHSEHGWDVYDPDGSNTKYRLLRRALRPLVGHYIALSKELERYLRDRVGVPPARLSRICNGVDINHFYPPENAANRRQRGAAPAELTELAPPGTLLIGSVGRLQAIKAPLDLVQAFLILLEQRPRARERLRLALIGDGPLYDQAIDLLRRHNALQLAWLPGNRGDIAKLLRTLDLFVLPSLAEGISNTILEAMASGLPVIASRVGGNPELINDGETGRLVPAGDPAAIAAAISYYLERPEQLGRHGQTARQHAETRFSIDVMVQRYLAVYDRLAA